MGGSVVVRLAAEKTIIKHLRVAGRTVNRRHVLAHSRPKVALLQRLLPSLRAVSRRCLWVLFAIRVRALSCLGV